MVETLKNGFGDTVEVDFTAMPIGAELYSTHPDDALIPWRRFGVKDQIEFYENGQWFSTNPLPENEEFFHNHHAHIPLHLQIST